MENTNNNTSNGSSTSNPLQNGSNNTSTNNTAVSNQSNPPTSSNTLPSSVPSTPPVRPVFETTPAFSGMNSTMQKPIIQHPTPSVPVSSVPSTSSTSSFTPPPVAKYTSTANTPSSNNKFGVMSNAPSSISSTSSTSKQSSSHGMLWLMIFLTILFLAVVAGVGYWYLKVYTPGLMSDDNTSTTTSTTTTSTFPSAVKTLTTIPAGTIQKPQNPPRPATLSHAFSVNDQDAVSSYITKNINALSPIKSSLGYTVSDITFDGPDRAIVTYGNSRAHYSAVAVAHIDTNGNVQVTSFTILEK